VAIKSAIFCGCAVAAFVLAVPSAWASVATRLREKIGFKRAAVAVARKLAVIMHAMLKTGEIFERAGAVA
jgi:transposase